ncbi:hypothetical protein IE53DRAFT_370207 [Violaceomyces palustris]|uniref:Uncharacterized protein n=1 Tax=Violaceomyces palustris TaxID=1673888 RepID=A0ACD0NSX4_9BASI|nr:hypothetical protein IE53DRAFT_370207 [Violaceomyces palustris]
MFSDMATIMQSTSSTFLDLTPTIVLLLSPDLLPYVSYILLGGEALPCRMLEGRFSAGITIFNAFNAFSPAGCYTIVLVHNSDNARSTFACIPIAGALGHLHIYLLNDKLDQVRTGQIASIILPTRERELEELFGSAIDRHKVASPSSSASSSSDSEESSRTFPSSNISLHPSWLDCQNVMEVIR